MKEIPIIDTHDDGIQNFDAALRRDAQESGYLPLMTWADWELLQELHKARNAEGTAITVQFASPPELSVGYRPELFPSYDKQYESLARPEGGGITHLTLGGDPLPRAGKVGGAASGHTGGAGGKPAMNWQAVAADLQDQIGDWETKCTQLENERDDYHRSLQTALQLKEKYWQENAELSKSLQHYRNAYFADQGKEGNSDGQK